MTRRLYRSRKHRMLGGVAGGIAEYFDIDPVIVRALFIITTFGWGVSIIIYIILWIIIPSEELIFGEVPVVDESRIGGAPDELSERKECRRGNMRMLFGAMLIVFGLVMLIGNIIPGLSFHNLWPIALIAFGIFILYRTYNNTVGGGNEIG